MLPVSCLGVRFPPATLNALLGRYYGVLGVVPETPNGKIIHLESYRRRAATLALPRGRGERVPVGRKFCFPFADQAVRFACQLR
jgi:hypothetical protein